MNEVDFEVSYEKKSGSVYRNISIGANRFQTRVDDMCENSSAYKSFCASILSKQPEYLSKQKNKKINFIDLFCGGGGLSYGVQESLKALGHSSKLLAACDLDSDALKLIKKHFNPYVIKNNSVETLVKYAVDPSGRLNGFIHSPEILDSEFAQFKGKVDLLIGGPPCQGHSNLNNHTRRADERNRLYYVMPALAIALDIPVVIIENVRQVIHSHEDVVENTKNIFRTYGFKTEEIILDATNFGIAQTRKRHFLVASKRDFDLSVASVVNKLQSDELMTFDDVNTELPPLDFFNKFLEENSDLSSENLKRIDYLISEQAWDLPNKFRPECHREGTTYKSVYGRVFPDKPMGTITTGFNSPGRGRFVHPREKRTINIREAGRIQSFPDYYWKLTEEIGFVRNNYAKIIGDAVPPKMIEPIIFSLSKHFS